MGEQGINVPMGVSIVDAYQCPEAIPVVARWLKAQFASNRPQVTEASYAERLRATPVAGAAVPRTWLAVAGAEPVGCARLVASDHADRPELTPWLASVYVTPGWRRQGIASALVRTVQAASRQAGYPHLYLYTPDQARLYARIGFQTIGTVIFPNDGRVSDLMIWTSAVEPTVSG